MKTQRYLDHCPIGCEAPLENTTLQMAQGCLLRCTACGHLVSQVTPSEFMDSMAEFNQAVGTWPAPENEGSLTRSTRKTLKTIGRLMKTDVPQLKLLDVGCSSGAFIFMAARMGVTCEGVEPAKQAALTAQKAGLNVHHGFVEQIALPENFYDVITLFEVIEHLKDPASVLSACHRLLKTGGLMVIRTANTDSWTVRWMKEKWRYFDLHRHGGHISFFNPKSMTTLARQTGFKMIRLDTHSVTLSEKKHGVMIQYRVLKIISELLNLPAKLTGNGQEMQVFLEKI
jgi:2-polyprenyl-3-methyl-5-hydroxy-6-metoxy-1,4-benzoquinol methylase